MHGHCMTSRQVKIYMNARKTGFIQTVAAAKTLLSPSKLHALPAALAETA